LNIRARRTDAAVGWVPVAGLSDLARALLGDRRDGRDDIPVHVRDRVVALAEQWAAHGFTAQTVGAWTDLEPSDAGVLAAAGYSPPVLQRHVVATAEGGTSLWLAVTSGALTAQEAVDELRAAGVSGEPAATGGSTPRVAPAVFSHPAAEPARDTTDQRSRSMPQRTPFNP
jgi:hypothetical protein